MLHKTEIAQRDPLRQAIEAHVNEYLSRGGIIRVCSPGESATPEEYPTSMRKGQYKKSHEHAMRAEAARFEGDFYA